MEQQELKPVRFSRLKHVGRSGLHYAHNLEHGVDETASMRLGTAAHSLAFNTRTVVELPKTIARRDVRIKAYRDFVEEQGPDAVILTSREYKDAHGMAGALMRHTDAMRLLRGRREQELPIWKYADRECGGRPDAVTDDWITDLKTCDSSHPVRFVNKAIWMAYHAQLAWYLHGNRETGGTATLGFIAAVESKAPHAITCFQLSPRALEAGEKLWVSWMEKLLVLESSNEWPAYSETICDFDVPEQEQELIFADDEEEAA